MARFVQFNLDFTADAEHRKFVSQAEFVPASRKSARRGAGCMRGMAATN
jgi:hypothetical protein